ncbi:Glucosaminyl phosphatidylinositol (GlcN-PI) nositol acylation protein [Serendipita sp. 400]|nr:Glucosaminyl phosphatidylinositol (GlcN-PI) nositol acylation protein [Serendipita sp. 400]
MLPVKDWGVSRRLANLQYVLWVATFNMFFLLLYICHDIYFFPFPFRKPRATDAAKQLGPTAPAMPNETGTSNSSKVATSWTTAVSIPASGRSPSSSLDYSSREKTHHNGGMLSPPPPTLRSSSKQGYLTPGDSVSDFEESPGGGIEPNSNAHTTSQKRKKAARKSWEGPDLVLRRGFEDEGERLLTPLTPHMPEGRDSNSRHTSRRSRTLMKMERDRLLADSKPSSPELLEAINQNGLVIFLLANLLTGLINLTIPTIYLSDSAAMAILVPYLLVLCVFAWTFKDRRLVKL